MSVSRIFSNMFERFKNLRNISMLSYKSILFIILEISFTKEIFKSIVYGFFSSSAMKMIFIRIYYI